MNTEPTKRTSGCLSPLAEGVTKKAVGDMAVGDLLSMMQTSMTTILEQKMANLATKSDIEDLTSKITAATAEMDEIRTENKNLKEEIKWLKEMRHEDSNNIKWLEYQVKNTKLIFKGLESNIPPIESVSKVCAENLKLNPNIISSRKLFTRNGTQTVIAEFENESITSEILKATKNLAGTTISIDRDLNPRRQKNKRAMLMVRKQILSENKTYKVLVRDDKLLIKDKWFVWNGNNELVCGRQSGEEALKELYGNALKTFSFKNTYEETASKN